MYIRIILCILIYISFKYIHAYYKLVIIKANIKKKKLKLDFFTIYYIVATNSLLDLWKKKKKNPLKILKILKLRDLKMLQLINVISCLRCFSLRLSSRNGISLPLS